MTSGRSSTNGISVPIRRTPSIRGKRSTDPPYMSQTAASIQRSGIINQCRESKSGRMGSTPSNSFRTSRLSFASQRTIRLPSPASSISSAYSRTAIRFSDSSSMVSWLSSKGDRGVYKHRPTVNREFAAEATSRRPSVGCLNTCTAVNNMSRESVGGVTSSISTRPSSSSGIPWPLSSTGPHRSGTIRNQSRPRRYSGSGRLITAHRTTTYTPEASRQSPPAPHSPSPPSPPTPHFGHCLTCSCTIPISASKYALAVSTFPTTPLPTHPSRYSETHSSACAANPNPQLYLPMVQFFWKTCVGCVTSNGTRLEWCWVCGDGPGEVAVEEWFLGRREWRSGIGGRLFGWCGWEVGESREEDEDWGEIL